MKQPNITTKTISSFKYKKNEAMLNSLEDFKEEKIDFASIVEQGQEIVKDKLTKKETQKEYAIIKFYFKD